MFVFLATVCNFFLNEWYGYIIESEMAAVPFCDSRCTSHELRLVFDFGMLLGVRSKMLILIHPCNFPVLVYLDDADLESQDSSINQCSLIKFR